MTTQIDIKKSDLVSCIENNINEFGNDFAAIYADVNSNVDFRTSEEDNWDWMPVLTFGGMGDASEWIEDEETGELVADNSNFSWNKFKGDRAIAEYIVDDGNCLTFDGKLLNDGGTESEYYFLIR